MTVRLYGATSGYVDLDAPAVAGSASVTLPGSGTLALSSQLKVLQVVSTAKTDTFTTNSTSYTDVTGLSASITPSSTASKILVLMDVKVGSDNAVSAFLRLVRGSTSIYVGDSVGNRIQSTWANSDDPSGEIFYQGSGIYLDSPATVSATTYKVQMLSEPIENVGSVYINRSGLDGNTSANARTASSITVMEIAA